MASTTTTTTSTTTRSRSRSRFSRSLRRPSTAASTPDLNTAYRSHSRINDFFPASLSRKASRAALIHGATVAKVPPVPDVSERYALEAALSNHYHDMIPTTPGRPSADDVAVGDFVDVPGGMYGTVRFVGTVQGKKGTFAGVELNEDFAGRGKNSGDVEGISYFNTDVPGAGIFLPVAKAARRHSPANSYPMTPTPGGLRAANQNSTNFTPPTPGLKFSASVGPGGRAPSPQGKKPRTSLPRPDSPVRRTQMTPGPRPSIGTPAPKAPTRYGSPTNKFAQSVRGTSGDPAKRGLQHKPSLGLSLGPRSASAMGSVPNFDEEPIPAMPQQTNGSLGSVSSFNNKLRPMSRANGINDEEVERLRAQLEDRDRQLREQASTLAEMESSLTELQTLMDEPGGFPQKRSSLDDKDSTTLRAMLREKNDKISMLTSEFDAHRADFRSTIDTLEMASTETERVYEKRIDELMGDVQELESRNLDVDSVANQLRQLEELVQELEEGLEDARRGEAEARGEAEFLRGEVERTRTELRREREKFGSNPSPNGEQQITSKEMEQKEDEIRGLKAIIHSLSRDSIPGPDERTPTNQRTSFMGGDAEGKVAHDNLERQVAELQSVLDKKNNREEELERELDALRRGSSGAQLMARPSQRSSLRDSRDTVIPARNHEARSPEPTHRRGNTLDTMPESDTYSAATETSTLWCEICETSGHDILTCTNMFGPEGANTSSESKTGRDVVHDTLKPNGHDDALPAPLSPAKSKSPGPAGPEIKILPNPMESGPVAGKESGIMDPEKWCAICERDGHDSVDCPFEDAF